MQIILLGYMASGKSTIGKLLAKAHNIPFLDLDDYIIEKEGLSIPEIFAQKGEIYFRKKEHESLKEVLESKNNWVLSLGGGTPCYANNMELIQQKKVAAFYLKASITTLSERLLQHKNSRPLIAFLEDEQVPEFIAKHLFERRFFYEQALYTIVVDQKSTQEVISEIQKKLS